ncbi:cell division protein FtsX [Sphingomonas sp. RS6]
MIDARTGGAAGRRLLDDGRRLRAMAWIMAIMVFLTVLAGALGLGMSNALAQLDRQLAGQLTVQIVETDARLRDAEAKAVVKRLKALPQVTSVREADRARLAALLKPWLGAAGLDADLPMPAIIDVDTHGGDAAGAVAAAVRRIAPSARVDRNAAWLSPARGLLSLLRWVAIGLVAVIAAATAAVVVLAARAGLDTHRDTIDVLHMLGSTDRQVARLFQRRIAFDALAGGVPGAAAGLLLVVFLQAQTAALGSEVLGGTRLAPVDWILLLAVPLAFALLSTAAARTAVLRALGERL